MATDLLHHPARPPRIPAVARILSQFDRPKLEGFITVAISLLDVMEGDPDLEQDDSDLEYSGDERDAAWTERLNQTRAALPRTVEPGWHGGASEDAEDDDGGGSFTDDEPGFDARSRRLANALGGGGAGCAINGDCELNGDEGECSR